MKLPAALLAVMSLTGCETAVDFENRSGPETKTVTEQAPVERVRVEMPREFAKAPTAAPKPIAKPIRIAKPKPVVKPEANACGPCGMG